MRLSRIPAMRSLRAFCIAARHRSFKVAADELFLTPSAVSHQMKELEDALGVRLFERKTRSIDLTVAGHTLHDEIAPLLEALERSITQVARRGNRRRLQVLAPPFFASELLMPRLHSFLNAYPDIDIQLDTGDARPVAHPATADMSILLADSPPNGLKIERLFSLKLVAVCAAEHLAAVARYGRLVFAELPIIVHKLRPFAWSEWSHEVGLDPPEAKSIIELDTMSAVVNAAAAGLGIALVPDALCGRWFRSGALTRIFSVHLPIGDTYFLACRPKDAERPEVAALIEWAIGEFRTPAGRVTPERQLEPVPG